MKDDGGIVRKEELFCAIVCSLYCCAGVALFLTGKAPVITESTAAMGALGLKAYLEAQKPNALNLKAD